MSEQYYIASQQVTAHRSDRDEAAGMAIRLPDGCGYWMRMDEFETTHMPMGEKNGDPNKNGVTAEMVDGFIAKVESHKIGLKTTVVLATLVNGYELAEFSSCIDPKQYDQDTGTRLALDKIKQQVWRLLGFLVQTGRYGFDAVPVDAR